MHMRLHITLDDDLVEEIDELAGRRGRSAFIRTAVIAEAERQRRVKSFWSAFGAIPDFAPDVSAEAVGDERRRATEARDADLARHRQT